MKNVVRYVLGVFAIAFLWTVVALAGAFAWPPIEDAMNHLHAMANAPAVDYFERSMKGVHAVLFGTSVLLLCGVTLVILASTAQLSSIIAKTTDKPRRRNEWKRKR